MSDLFAIEVPKPGAPLKEYVIDDDNRTLQAARQEPRLLSAQQIKRLNKQRNENLKRLAILDYVDLRDRLVTLRLTYEDIRRQYAKTPDTDECRARRIDLKRQGAAARLEIIRLQHRNKKMLELANETKNLQRQLDDHAAAIRRQKRVEQLRLEQENECYEWHDKIIGCWTRLGYYYDPPARKGKVRRKRVQIERIVVTADEVQFKIAASAKRLGGWIDLLPHGVRVADLISDETRQEIEIAVQRQVTTHYSKLNGAWVVVHRPATANSVLEYVTLSQIMAKRDRQVHDRFPLALGVSAGRKIEYVYLDKQPHLLVGGETGSGKSNFSNSIICQLIGHYKPSELQLILIDLKEEAEYRKYRDIPHMMLPTVGDLGKAVSTLAQLELMRVQRMQKIANAGCHDIVEYNRRVDETNKMPRVVCMIDEYADVLSDRAMGKEVERFVTSLTQKARAAGINLIISTQNPYTSILPGHIKGNMGARIALAMADPNNSRTILGTGDAALLPRIEGRAVYKAGANKKEIQTPHCRAEDYKEAIANAMKHERVDVDAPPAPTSEEAIAAARPQKFDVEKLLEIAIEQLDGNLGYTPIYNAIKHDFVEVSRGDVEKMIKPLIDDGAVVYDGLLYPLFKVGKGWRIDLENAEEIEEGSAA